MSDDDDRVRAETAAAWARAQADIARHDDEYRRKHGEGPPP